MNVNVWAVILLCAAACTAAQPETPGNNTDDNTSSPSTNATQCQKYLPALQRLGRRYAKGVLREVFKCALATVVIVGTGTSVVTVFGFDFNISPVKRFQNKSPVSCEDGKAYQEVRASVSPREAVGKVLGWAGNGELMIVEFRDVRIVDFVNSACSPQLSRNRAILQLALTGKPELRQTLENDPNVSTIQLKDNGG